MYINKIQVSADFLACSSSHPNVKSFSVKPQYFLDKSRLNVSFPFICMWSNYLQHTDWWGVFLWLKMLFLSSAFSVYKDKLHWDHFTLETGSVHHALYTVLFHLTPHSSFSCLFLLHTLTSLLLRLTWSNLAMTQSSQMDWGMVVVKQM